MVDRINDSSTNKTECFRDGRKVTFGQLQQIFITNPELSLIECRFSKPFIAHGYKAHGFGLFEYVEEPAEEVGVIDKNSSLKYYGNMTGNLLVNAQVDKNEQYVSGLYIVIENEQKVYLLFKNNVPNSLLEVFNDNEIKSVKFSLQDPRQKKLITLYNKEKGIDYLDLLILDSRLAFK